MSSNTRHKKHRQQYSLPEAGSSPGLIYIDPNSLETKIVLHTITKDSYTDEVLADLQGVKELLQNKTSTYWIEVQGFRSEPMFQYLLNDLEINKLILEDITRTYQRPKYEQYDNYDFAISRMLLYDEEKCLINEQFACLLTENTLFTFQEKY